MAIKFFKKLKFGLRPLPAGVPHDNPYVMIATLCGAGRLRPGSGTWGSLAALPFGYAIQYVWGAPGLALAIVALLIIGTKAAEFYGRKSGTIDDHAIVVDEAVGLWIAALPADNIPQLWLIAFILFRVFDIYKPWPASFFDNRSRDARDVMIDDVVAGFYAMIGVMASALPHLTKS